MCISALISFSFSISVVAFDNDSGPGDGLEDPNSGGWAPLTRWVTHPDTGMLVILELIEEKPLIAYYADPKKATPPIRTVCEANPDICVLEREFEQ